MKVGSTRIRGNALSMRVTDPLYGQARDYWADATSVVLTPQEDNLGWDLEDGQVLTLTRWHLAVTAVQSTAEDSLWTFLWDHVDQVVPFAYAPHGNDEPTPDQPHFTGLLQIPAPPALGGDAGPAVEYTFTVQLPIIQGPLRVTE